MQHGRRCVGATIVVSKRGEFVATATPPVHGTKNTSAAIASCFSSSPSSIRLFFFLLPSSLSNTINTQPPFRLCSDSSELVATDTTEAAGKDRFRAARARDAVTRRESKRERYKGRKERKGESGREKKRMSLRCDRSGFVIRGEKRADKKNKRSEVRNRRVWAVSQTAAAATVGENAIKTRSTRLT
ncbi:hypothetical protein WN55_09964 [Dufourea novaeangliae]|uniref:Uncharacterized protein n=1 Tax=Dufourea novaeangliae TaxID=178035 RepID=A0A154P7R8_DUFNO|nr:hypothetical protein WN55_09964 [Dufourea novaeangliae]